MRTRKAFSLIELILTVGILAFVASSALFIFQNQLVGNLSSDAQIVVDRLEGAQSRAIAGVNGTAWGIHFDNTSSTPFYALFQGTTYASPTTIYYLSSLVQFSTPAANASTDVVFSKLTGLIPATTTIVLKLNTNASSTETITVLPSGAANAQ